MPFNVFLSHSSADKPVVEELARRLAKEGIQAWLDKWHLIPGDPWQPGLEKALADSETCAVFVGPSGFGPWQNEEMRAAIDRRVGDSGRHFRVIPVLLPGAERAERSSLPTFLAATTWVAFRDSLDDQDAFHTLVCGIRGVEPGAGPGQALYEGQCPYRGLRFFDVDDAAFFFGREALVEWLLNELRPATSNKQVSRFLAIVGASGSGKSSLARAGLVATIKRSDLLHSSAWPVAICRPGPDPIESLAVALSEVMNIGQGVAMLSDLIGELQKNERTLHLLVRQALPGNAPGMRVVVVVDQFEEVFTLCSRDELRDAFVRNLLYAAKVAQGQTLVILGMRADFYARCAANAELAAALSDHHLLVGPMTDEELRRAIQRPALLVGCELEAGLVDLLVQDVRHQPGALPLLQHALLELWHKREGRRLTVKAYQEIGKLEGALQRRADATLKAFSEGEQELCRRTFLRLTQPGEGTEDTKRRASMQELLSLSGRASAEEAIIQKLADASLLTTEGDLTHKDAFVEVAHEALIRNWPQLRKWIDVDRAGLRTRTRLTESARDWKNSGRDPTYLYSGVRVAVAEEWAGSHPGELSIDEAEFLHCSREAQQQRETAELEAARTLAEALKERAEEAEKREQEEKVSGELRERLAREERERQERELEAAQKLARTESERADDQARAALRLRWLMVTMVVFFCAAVIAAIFAFYSAGESHRSAQQALSRQLAAQSLADADALPQRSLLLAAESVGLARGADIFHSEDAAKLLHKLLGATGGVPLVGHASAVTAVAFSDGRTIATGSADGTARLWDATHPQAAPLVLSGHTGPVTSLAFSGDGRWLATASADGTARLWDAKHPQIAPVVLAGHQGAINALAISADSRWLATASEDHTTRLWDLKAAHPSVSPVILGGHTERATHVAFSGTGRWLATASTDDHTVWLWDMADPAHAGHRMTHKVPVPEDAINAIAFSPDERRLAVTFGYIVQLWDLTAADPPAKPLLQGSHAQWILAVGFTPDGHWLATAAIDAAVKLWDLTAADPAAHPIVLSGHRAAINALAFSSTGRWLATAGDDATVRLWDLADPTHPSFVLGGHESAINALTFSPDGLRLATASNDTQARLWDIPDPSLDRVVMRGHSRIVRAVAFSPDGQRLVTGSDDETARVWNVTNPQADPLVLSGGGRVTAVSFSVDGQWLATGSNDPPSLRLWKLTATDPAVVPVILRQNAYLMNLAFSPDGRWLVTTGWDGNLRLWKMDNGTPSPEPSFSCKQQEPVRGLAFSADGSEMATGSQGYTARLWRLADKNPFSAPFVIPAGPVVGDLALSRDGGWLAMTSWEPDYKARLWQLTGAMPPHLSAVLQFKKRPRCVALSPDAHWLAAGADDETVQLLDMTDPTKAPISLLGHHGRMLVLAFSPDSQSLASLSEDHTIRLWDPARPTADPAVLHDGSGFVNMSFSPDGRWLATGSGDGTVRLWCLQVDELLRLACRTAGRNLTKDERKTFLGY